MKRRNRLVFPGALAFCFLLSLQAYAGTLQYDQPKGMDRDDMLDYGEVYDGVDPFVKDALLDPDGNGYTNFQEHLFEANPTWPIRLFPLTVDPDFDQNLRTDFTVWRPTTRAWYAKDSQELLLAYWGWVLAKDIPFTGHFDEDGITDLGVWRPGNGTFYVLLSSFAYDSAHALIMQWGKTGDVPVPGDYDGDGISDFAIWRPSTGTWWIKNIYGEVANTQLGVAGDVPVPGDYDGDLMMDFAVWRPSPGTWYIKSAIGYTFDPIQWGLVSGDVPVPADFDGDGVTDLGIWRPSTGMWYIKNVFGDAIATLRSGSNGDIPLAGDYDGDGVADIAIWRPSTGTWFIATAVSGFSTGLRVSWGGNGDLPLGCTPFSAIQKYLAERGYY